MIKNKLHVQRSFNVVGMMFVLLSNFGCLQASSRPSSVMSNQDSAELCEIEILSQPKVRALFNAIRCGYHDDIVNALFDAAVKNSRSPEAAQLIEKQAARVYKTDTPNVRNLKYRINSGGTPSAEREVLKEQLQAIQNS